MCRNTSSSSLSKQNSSSDDDVNILICVFVSWVQHFFYVMIGFQGSQNFLTNHLCGNKNVVSNQNNVAKALQCSAMTAIKSNVGEGTHLLPRDRENFWLHLRHQVKKYFITYPQGAV